MSNIIEMPTQDNWRTLPNLMERILYANKDHIHAIPDERNSLRKYHHRFYEDEGYVHVPYDGVADAYVDDELLEIALDCIFKVDNMGTKETFIGTELFIYFDIADLHYAVTLEQIIYPDKRSLVERLLKTELIKNIYIQNNEYIVEFNERRSLPYLTGPVDSTIDFLKELNPEKYRVTEKNKFTV